MIETIILPEALKRERTEVYEGKSTSKLIILTNKLDYDNLNPKNNKKLMEPCDNTLRVKRQGHFKTQFSNI